MKLYIKHMVGLTCEAQVKKELDRLEIPFAHIYPGVVELLVDPTLKQRGQLKNNLLPLGMKLQKAKKAILIEKIKDTIIEMIEYSDGQPLLSNSVYLRQKLNHNYTYLANIFSDLNGISIQQFIILSKVEKVKELLLSSDLSLSAISYQLHYSSVAHLSGQFKKITGLSPSYYKLIMRRRIEAPVSMEN